MASVQGNYLWLVFLFYFLTCLLCFLPKYPSFSYICSSISHGCFLYPYTHLTSLIFSFFLRPFQLYSLSLLYLFLSFPLFCVTLQTFLVLVFVPPHLLPPACSAAALDSQFLSGSAARIAAKDGLFFFQTN